MKYQVQIKYTNPSHEHVSLRRRVESVTRLVEAANEQEAINRAANQQRALGFIIKEAEVYMPVNGLHSLALNNNEPQKGKEKKKELVGKDGEKTDVGTAGGMKEGFDTDPKDIAAYLVDRHGKGKVTMDHIEAYERRRDSHRPIEKHEVMKFVKKMSEEVEQIDEGKAHDRITAGLKDKNRDVRVDAILHPKATPEHISIALKDEHPYVREAAIRHRNATPEHISAALKDDHMVVRKAAIKNRNASSENISAALKDGDIYTRMNAIKHRNVKPEHIAIALKDKESYVRDAAKKRMKKEEVFTEEESIEEAKQVDHAKTIAKSLAATHPNFRVSSYDGDHGRAHVVHHKDDTRNFRNGEELMGPNIQLQHNHKTNKVHMEMQGDYDNVPDRDEETHHPDKAHEAAHKMFKPAIDLIHKTDKTTTNEEVEQVDEAQKKLKPTYWRAEWRLGTKSEVDKNNKKIYDKLVKTDPEKAAKFHDNLMKIRKEEVEAVEEGADDWKKAFKKVAAKNYEKDIAAVRSSAHRLDKATRGFPAKPDTKPTDSNIDYIKQNIRKGVTKPHSMQEEVVSEAMPAYVKKGQEKFDAQARAQRATEKADKAQAGTLVAQKSRKAAEKMVNRAKGNANKIDVAPTIEPGKPNLQR